MLKQVDTENGKRWAIVFDAYFSLEDLAELKKGLVNLMVTATDSGLFESSKDDFYSALMTVREMCLDASQAADIERLCKSGKLGL